MRWPQLTHKNQSPLPCAAIRLKSSPSTQYGQRTFLGFRSRDHSIMDLPRFLEAQPLRPSCELLSPAKVSIP